VLDFIEATRRSRTDDLLITNPIQDDEEPEQQRDIAPFSSAFLTAIGPPRSAFIRVFRRPTDTRTDTGDNPLALFPPRPEKCPSRG
jgi:hypothetical protein